MDWAAAISATATAVGIVKDLREIDKGLGEAEQRARLADVLSNMADVKIALAEARQEAQEKDAEIERLRKAFEFKATLVETGGFKYESFDDGTPKGEAFCPRCEQNYGRYYRLNATKGYVKYGCPECKSEFQHVQTFGWQK